MEFEIWASDSGNRIFASPDLNDALTWALDYWIREGDDALVALSIGDEQDRWVISGTEFREFLRDRMWHGSPSGVITSANNVVRVDRSRMAATQLTAAS
jgi:hypothetical protein